MTQVLGSWALFLVPSLAYALFPDLGLTQGQYIVTFTAPLLAAIFVAPLGGALCDRYGIRLTVAIGAFFAALAGMSRSFATGFETLLALMCVQGAATSLVNPNLAKLVGVWFPARQFGVASGVYVSGQAIGMSIGLATGPLFAGWREAFLTVGLAALAVVVLWAVVGRSYPYGVKVVRPSMVAGLRQGLRSRNMRLLCAGQFMLIGGFNTFVGNFPKALVSVREIAAGTAGAISSLMTFGAVVGSMVLPAVSDRVGLRKPFVYLGSVGSATCYFLGWYLSPGWWLAPLMAVGGFLLGGLVPVMFTLPLEFPDIGHKYAGGASGLLISSANVGGFLMPVLVTSPLMVGGTQSAYDAGFLVGAVLLLAMALPVTFVRETGRRRARRLDAGGTQATRS